MYFPDLSPYSYGRRAPDLKVLNVGWLSAGHDFPRRPPEPDLVASLKRLAESPVELYLGFHICEFCPQPWKKYLATGRFELLPGTKNGGEIRVADPSGKVFAAPTMIVHYVETHEYAPPEAFVKAVLAATRQA